MPSIFCSRSIPGTALKKHRWLDFSEYALLLGAGAGTVASLATQQLIFASAPLSLLAALGLVNRQRLEQQLAKERRVTQALDKKLSQNVEALRDQVAELPTPELLTGFQRSVIAQNEQAVTRFSKALEHTRQQLEQQIDEIETPDLSLVYQDVMQLQDQYTYLCASLNNMSAQIQQLSSLSRLEDTEAQVSQLKTELMQLRVNLDTFSSDSKTSYAGLRDTLQHVERRLRQIPLQGNPAFLKEEIHELTRTIAEMVPRPEFLALSSSFQELREQHRHLRQLVEAKLKAPDPGTLAQVARVSEAPVMEDAAIAHTTATFDQTLTQLTAGLQQLEAALTQATGEAEAETPIIEATINQAVVNYLSRCRLQLSTLNQLTHQMEDQHQQLSQQLRDLPDILDAAAIGQQIERLQSRLDQTEDHLGTVKHAVDSWLGQSPHTTQMAGEAQWILDFPAAESFPEQEANVLKSSSRKALDQALLQARKRLLLVWPWAEDTPLDDAMVACFQQVLARKCRLEIGWCHLDYHSEGRLLRSINQRWGDYGYQHQQLKRALNKLLPLKQAYPDLFKFKILGTQENFLVCDRTFAVLGMQSLDSQSSVFPQVNLKLRTTNAQVIQQLIQRFDKPVLDAQDAMAYFNRGTTRYDLRDQPGAIADYTQVIEISPAQAMAYNNRGLAWADLGEFEKALQDFSQAISLDDHLFVAYCNRGVIRLDRRDYAGAIADLTEAVRLHPSSPIPYFYRGQALQALGDLIKAVADFSCTIERSPNLALPYCYRGAVYQKQGDTRRAIADLEVAARLLQTTGDVKNLTQVVRTLEKLQQTTPVRATAQVS
jgi:tetratricopeptide (TPR) repeat protein/archaellum component FlaC